MDSNEEEFSPDEDRILKEREMFRDELVRALGKRTEEPEPVAGVNMELQNMQTSEAILISSDGSSQDSDTYDVSTEEEKCTCFSQLLTIFLIIVAVGIITIIVVNVANLYFHFF